MIVVPHGYASADSVDRFIASAEPNRSLTVYKTAVDGWDVPVYFHTPPATPIGWQSMESAPKDGTQIIVSTIGDAIEFGLDVVEWRDDSWFKGWLCGGHGSGCYGPEFTPTVWIPIPEDTGENNA